MKRKIALAFGVLVAGVLVAAFALYQSTFGPIAPPPDVTGPLTPSSDVVVVPDGYVMMFLVPTGGDRAVLVDCGNDKDATAIKAALAAKKWTLDAILVTHGHPDHVGGCNALGAPVHALADEVPYVNGTKANLGPVPAMAGAHGLDVKVARALTDGESLTFGEKTFTAHQVPGHTPGSAVFVVDGTAFFGDAASLGKDGKVIAPPTIFSDDVPLSVASLHALAPKLKAVTTFAFAHSAALSPAAPDALASVQ